MDILSSKVFEVDESCYFIAASSERPFIWLRFKGVIKKRHIENDNVTYLIKVQEVLEDAENIKMYLHRHTYRMWNLIGNRGQMKRIDCFDLVLNMSTFNKNFAERHKTLQFTLPSVFVFETESEMNAKVKSTFTVMMQHLQESMNLLTQRYEQLNFE